MYAATAAIECADVVLVTFEMPVSTICEAIDLAHRHGALVVVQPAPVLANPADAASLPWNCVDVVVPNVIEARALLSASHPEHAEEHFNDESMLQVLARDLGVSRIAVTLAEAGCLTYSSGVTQRYPARPSARVVDTTGASDAFTAALALKLATAAPESDAIDAALSAAAHVISQPGGYESMPRPDGSVSV